MLKYRVPFLLVLCLANPAQAGLFSDDEARKQVQQVEARVLRLETGVTLKLESDIDQHTKSLIDLQGRIEELNNEIRMLRGQNEELAHGLKDAEKREKDFYVDLDTRLRHFESAEQEAAAVIPAAEGDTSVDPDPAPENRAYEAAYRSYRKGEYADASKAFQAFIGKYPDSVYIAHAHYWMASAQLNLQDYQNALEGFQLFIKDFSGHVKVADALFNLAECQQALKQTKSAKKTLKQLLDKYPSSEAADKAKKLLAQTK